MSRSLSFDCEWIDQPAAADPLERRTWACLRIRAAGRAVTRLWDRSSSAERVSIFVPVFSLAKWIVDHWWAILYEPQRTDEMPSPDAFQSNSQRAWISRHCLRAADSGLLLPRTFLYSDGKGLCVNWFADEPGAYAQMPGEFIDQGFIRLQYDEAEEGLRAFVREVIGRIENGNDPREVRLREDWHAISTANTDELAFCHAAGRLGLDPYRVADWPQGAAALVEGDLDADADLPIAADFLEAVDIRNPRAAATAPEIWKWTSTTRTTLDLRRSPAGMSDAPSFHGHPANTAYRVARQLRQTLNGGNQAPLPDLAAASETLNIPDLHFESRNHLPGRKVLAAVGWQNGNVPVFAGPPVPREASKRFLEARALFLAAYGCHSGARLITTAHTWDQKASRAFAAELLAPQTALVSRLDDVTSSEELNDAVQQLATEYGVSVKVVEHQLENAGFTLDGE